MSKNQYCVIMAGGVGERFWPVSRSNKPKQFIDILGVGETLIQRTFKRLRKICPAENILVVTSIKYKELVINQLPEIPLENILFEPARRNTAPCIAYACHKIAVKNPKATVLIAPSDHVILDEHTFTSVAKSALHAAAHNPWLLTLGITPSRPDTGYGYIKYQDGNPYPKDEHIYKVGNFTEKPNLEIAEEFLKSGDYLWNAGIFVWSIPTILEALQKFVPEIDALFAEGKEVYFTAKEKKFIDKIYSLCRSISIDYAVMEKAENVYVLKSDFGWSDLGTWGALYVFRDKNEQNNVIIRKNMLTYDTTNSIIDVPICKMVAIQGLDGYIVIERDGVLLICKQKDENRIRDIVNDIRVKTGEEFV